MSAVTFHDAAALPHATGTDGIIVEIARTPAALRAVWEALGTTGTVSPYQSIRWIEAYLKHVNEPASEDGAILTLRGLTGTVLMVLPLAIARSGGLRVARFIGGKHANFNLPLFSGAADTVSRDDILKALHDAGRQLNVDIFQFINQPLEWDGRANPLAQLSGQPSPSAGYKFSLGSNAEDVLHARFSKDTRKKLRQKEAKLQQVAVVRYHRPAPGPEALAMLDSFLALKAARFKDQGISDPFAGDDVRAFLQTVTRDGTLEFHALMVNDAPAAIYAGVADAKRFSGVVTAFDASPEISRSSPGEVLLVHMIRNLCARGLTTFDLGVGEAHYKSKICDQTEPLFDSCVPVSIKGRLGALALSTGGRLKRWLKQSSHGQRLIAAVRKMKTRG